VRCTEERSGTGGVGGVGNQRGVDWAGVIWGRRGQLSGVGGDCGLYSMLYRRVSSSETYWRMDGRIDLSQVWCNFLGRVEEGSPRMREVCWWVVKVGHSGWQVSYRRSVISWIRGRATCDVAGHSKIRWISEPVTPDGQSRHIWLS